MLRRVSLLLLLLVMIPAAHGNTIPAQYREGVHTDYDLWKVSVQHYPEPWTLCVLEDLADHYTNSGRLDDLRRVMEWYYLLDQCIQNKEMMMYHDFANVSPSALVCNPITITDTGIDNVVGTNAEVR